MKRLTFLFTVLFAIGACGGGGSSSPRAVIAPPSTGIVDVIHASADAPAVTITVDGAPAFTDLDYTHAVALTPNVDDISVSVDAQLPDGTATTVIGPATITVTETDRITAIAIGPTAAIEPLLLSQNITGIAAGEAQVRVVHAAPDAPMVDVYVSAPGTDITTEMPLGTFEFRGVLGAVSVPAGTYQISVTLAGDPTAIVYQVEAALPADQDVIVAATPNTGAGPSPIKLVVAPIDPSAPPAGALFSATVLDADTPTDVRVVHASPDAPNVDVIANDDFGAPAVTNLAYTEATPFLTLPAAPINVKVVPTMATAPVVIDEDLTLPAGETLTVLAIDVLANIQPLVLTDDTRRVATEAKVRIVHASPTAGNVDIYVVAPGADFTAATPAFTDVPLGAETGYVPLTPGDYDVVVTPTGTTTAAIGPLTISVAASGIYTAIARDEVGIGLPLGLILLDDF